MTKSSTAEPQYVARSADKVCAVRIAKGEGCQGFKSNNEQLDNISSDRLPVELETMKRNIMEKKEYIQPVSELIEIGVLNVLALSKDDEQIDDEEQWSGEHRGDWDNIWKNM